MSSAYVVDRDEDSNGFKVTKRDGTFLGWVYPMDYIKGREGTWGAISSAEGEVSDPSLYREGFGSRADAAGWLILRAGTSEGGTSGSGV